VGYTPVAEKTRSNFCTMWISKSTNNYLFNKAAVLGVTQY